ncbi:MAG TPA: DnaA N-terminal domain-containing protein, partial [Elusimicrobiales bacterium]|nr:DnaA N-terminal domain-containing protein [Elusimicrobiales bacterium]
MDNTKDLKEFWQDILKRMEAEIGPDSVDLWLSPIKPLVIEADTLKLEVPDSMIYKTVKERYESGLIKTALAATGRNFSINYSLSLASSEPKPAPPPPVPAAEPSPRAQGTVPDTSLVQMMFLRPCE